MDWANGLNDGGPEFSAELAKRRDVYLAPYSEIELPLDEALDEVWAGIFEEELLSWSTDETTWPQHRTRQMFDAWFDAELADALFDLVPDAPLTEDEMDLADVDDALNTCAWCGCELPVPEGRMVSFRLTDRDAFAEREGRVYHFVVDRKRVRRGIVTEPDSTPAQEDADLIFRACSRACEKRIERAIPRALSQHEQRLGEASMK
jgi:hypothetical protein